MYYKQLGIVDVQKIPKYRDL